MGQKQISAHVRLTSAQPRNVRFVPKADIGSSFDKLVRLGLLTTFESSDRF